MPPLRLLRLLACVAAAGGALFQRQTPDDPAGSSAGSELAQLVASTNSQCGIHCQRAGSACVGFHRSGAACRLFSALYPGLGDTFVRLLRPPPAGYSACGSTAYRVLPPMARDLAKEACAAAGGRMAIPITAEERTCVKAVVTEANNVPGFNPPNLEHPHAAYIGVLIHGPGPDYSFTDLENNPLELPADIWWENQPSSNTALAYVTLLESRYFVWNTWSLLMNVCEVDLSE